MYMKHLELSFRLDRAFTLALSKKQQLWSMFCRQLFIHI